jgi:hypothetical protein
MIGLTHLDWIIEMIAYADQRSSSYGSLYNREHEAKYQSITVSKSKNIGNLISNLR